MRQIFIFIYLLNSFYCSSQKEDFNWLGGYNYDNLPLDTLIIEGYRMDFNNKPFKIENNVNLSFGILGNNTSISDKNGNLLFYTNGCAVMNKDYQVLPNGDSINGGKWFDIFWKHCSQGYPGVQDALLLNDPGNKNGYYLFHKTNIYNAPNPTTRRIQYTYIDGTLDNGKGDVTIKNKKINNIDNLLLLYFTGIKHKNKKDWWLFQPLENDSAFMTFLIDETGINQKPNQNTHQYFDRSRSSASGTARFSPDGTKYAIYNYYDQLHVYDFNRATGILSNHKIIEVYPLNEIDRSKVIFSSVEWSPNSRFIYCSSEYKLHQVDMWASNPQNAIQLVGEYDGTEDPLPTLFCFMVQGPDCRIYMTPKSSSWTIHTINKPNELGKACDFVQNNIRLQYPTGGTLPNFPRFRVDEEEKCDPTIASMFGETVYYRRNLEVYPNPSSGLFTIKIPELIGDAYVVVTDINGKLIFKKEIKNSIIEEVDITNFPSGRYNIDVYPIENNEKIFYGKQIIKIE
jgi:hypothetical protein